MDTSTEETNMISEHTKVYGSFTIKDIQDEFRTKNLPVPSAEEVLIRESISRKELHDRIGFVDPRGYFHLDKGVKKVNNVTSKLFTKAVKSTKSGPTKAERALEIYKNRGSMSREGVIQMFMQELGMTKAGATTYFYNAKRDAGEVSAPAEKPAKAKVAKVKAEPKVVVGSDEEDLEITELRKIAA
jgi:hypothetical protein